MRPGALVMAFGWVGAIVASSSLTTLFGGGLLLLSTLVIDLCPETAFVSGGVGAAIAAHVMSLIARDARGS